MDSAATRSRSISASSSTRTGFDTGRGSRTCLFFRRFVIAAFPFHARNPSRSTRYFACVAASKPRDRHASKRRSISASPTLDGATEVFRSRAMVRSFLAFRRRVPSERYGLIASKYTLTADGIVVRAIPGPAGPRCTRGRGRTLFDLAALPGSTRFVSVVSSFRALFPTGLGAPKAPCWESWFSLSTHELSPSSCAEGICRYGGIEVSA